MPSDLLDLLGYTLPTVGPVRATVQRAVATNVFTSINRQLLQQADQTALRFSGGRTTLTTLLVGLPTVFLTTTGAKSRLPRTAPLIGIPHEGSLGLIGSNFGGPSHPGWVHNLAADPRARLRYRHAEVDVMADQVDDERAERVWATAIQMYAGYASYRQRAGGRPIRVFVVRPA